jgi:hypothetical protein
LFSFRCVDYLSSFIFSFTISCNFQSFDLSILVESIVYL